MKISLEKLYVDIGAQRVNFALANYEDSDVLLEVHFTITILLGSIVSFFASSCSCDFCH